MSVIGSNILAGASGGAGAGGYEIERSLRFNSGDSAYLNRTPSAAGNRKTWTWSGWVKRSVLGSQKLFIAGASGTEGGIQFHSGTDNTAIRFYDYQSGAHTIQLDTTQLFRDVAGWYHIVAAIDTTQATASDRAKLYINGVQVTSFATATYPSQNLDTLVNNNIAHYLGWVSPSGNYFNGYLADVHFIDGQALAPTDFGETDDNGVWQPKAFAGSYTVSGTALASATGALPLLNTTGDYGGTVTSGVRSDSNAANIVLALPLNGANGSTTITDQSAAIKGSGSAKAITLYTGSAAGGAVISTAQSNYYGSSFYSVRGATNNYTASDYLERTGDTDLAFGTGDFCVEFWYYPTNLVSNSSHFDNRHPSTNWPSSVNGFIIYSNSSGTLYLRTGSGNIITVNNVLASDKWQHLAITRSSGTIKLFLDGVEKGSASNSNDFNEGRFRLGSSAENGQGSDGYYSDLRIYKGVAKYTSNFTVPVVPPSVCNSFHLDFKDNSSNAALGTDTSGVSPANTWTVNNLTAIVPTVQYGEDTSNSNFDSSSTSLTYDTTGFTYNNVSSPKTDTGQANASTVLKSANGSPISWTFSTDSTDRYIWTSSNGINWSSTGSTYPVSSSPQTVTAAWVAWAGGSNASTLTVTFASASSNDSLVDSPTNGTQTDTGAGGEVVGNYATLNPLAKASGLSLSNGNLDATGSAVHGCSLSTIFPSSGKYYAEYTLNTYQADTAVGVVSTDVDYNQDWVGEQAYTVGYLADGRLFQNGSSTNIGSYAAGDIIGVAFDVDTGKIWFSKNGTFINSGNPVAGTAELKTITGGKPLTIAFRGLGGAGSFNFGQRAFAYPLSGYKALCTANLPKPTIADGSKYFDTKLVSGNSSTQTISGFNFSPDFVWAKSRSHTTDNYLFDIVRGATNELKSNSTSAEGSNSGLTQFNSDGYNIGSDSSMNTSGRTYVNWAWDAGANSDKTYTVTVSGGNFYIDGALQPTLTLAEGSTYKFDQSAATNSGHPLRFSTTSDGTHGGGSEYTTGVTTAGTPGSAGAFTQIVIAASAPTLYAYCTNHSGMGFQVNTSDTGGATNLDGTIASRVMANPSAGFSIVSYTGTGSAQNTGHGLNATPAFVIIKNRTGSGTNWQVFGDGFERLQLNTTGGNLTDGYTLARTSTTISPTGNAITDNQFNASGNDYIAYCFAPVEGYSAIGSYVGNGNTAPRRFVYLGFRPAFVLIKAISISGKSWIICDYVRDGFNNNNDTLAADVSNTENDVVPSANSIAILSNGFQHLNDNSRLNESGATYIYYAVAENPFASNGGLAR